MEILIISEELEVAENMAKALALFNDIQPLKSISSSGRLPRDLKTGTAIIILVQDELELQKWVWGKIRKNYINPIIVLGFEEEKAFGKQQPVFNGRSDEPISSQSHGYKKIPFSLGEVADLINKLKTVKNLAFIWKWYANETAYLRHRVHSFHAPIPSLTLQETLERLNEVLDYFKMKEDTKESEELQNELRLMESAEWVIRAYNLGRKYDKYFAEQLG